MPDIRAGSPTRLAAGASIAVALLSALTVSVFAGGSGAEGGSTARTSETLEVLTTGVVDRLSTPTSVGSGQAILPVEVGDDTRSSSTQILTLVDEVRATGSAALGAWGRFVVSGDLTELDGHFHPDSPQYPLLVEKTADLAVDPLGEPPYVFVMADPAVEEESPGWATMQGLVAASRGDSVWQSEWLLVLVWSEESQSWRVWTLEEVG